MSYTITEAEPVHQPRTSDYALPWFALKVKARRELQVSDALRGKELEAFVPTVRECRKYSDRIRKVDAPLFPGYLFCRLNPSHRLPVLTTPGVEYILGSNGQLQAVPESEIGALQRLVSEGAHAKPWPYLKDGDRVRVEFGSFAGVEGLVVREGQSDRLVLSVTVLQRSVALEIDRTWIRPV